MRLFVPLLALLPAFSALQLPLPHLPTTAQDAIQMADSFLHPGNSESADPATILNTASDFSLESVTGDDFIHFTSARHPKHKIRIKSTNGFCDPSVKSYSGYLDIGDGKDLFFYFFESRSDPKKDPVVMWINGGPGCSSALGLFMELGPCSVKDDPKGTNDTIVNPYAWNDKANIFFLDEPIGVGFSYAEHHQSVRRAEEAGQDVQAFISIFFETFKEFQGRAFHMAGESYGGRYLPIFASAVVDGNKKLIAQGQPPINLQSVMIGNGVTDHYTTSESYFTFQCTIHGGLNATVQSISTCVALAEAVPKCHKFTQKGCIETQDYTTCTMALQYCSEMLDSSFLLAGVNPYDVSKPCSSKELSSSLCYSVTDKIRTYLDLPDVRKTLGVNPKLGGFSSCSNKVGREFGAALDTAGQTWLYVAALLERGIRVLSYVGTFDFICNHIANERWMEKLEWTGKEGYNAAEFADWTVDDNIAGSYKTYGNLTHLKILYAGHMVPYDKPKEALVMLNAWLDAEDLSKSQ
ncbi:Alpha/Beta hydrolase protein [Naematelia encephala]|uniref:Carboxypeptidase n=1 Tax=Naematelia encephala TaxID=71784 RepID=A0A1Y2BHP3_9TREE|nr:Alpha/Beta hydrolase protein [Naematelia encephala]